MTALRQTDPGKRLAYPIEVLRVRTQVRAYLWSRYEMDMAEAVDGLQAYAVQSGLVDRLGQNQVQEIMAGGFAPFRADLDHADDEMVPDLDDEPPPRRQRDYVPISTLWAAEYLVKEGDPDRFRGWLAKHTATERAGITRHLRGRQQ